MQVLRMFSENRTRARKQYREFMNEGNVVKKQEMYAAIDQRMQGDDDFVDRVLLSVYQKFTGTALWS